MRVSHVVLASVCLLALGRIPAQADAATPTGSLVAAFATEPTTLDPVRYFVGVDLYGIAQAFKQLLRVDPDGKTVNWLAESYSVGGTSARASAARRSGPARPATIRR